MAMLSSDQTIIWQSDAKRDYGQCIHASRLRSEPEQPGKLKS